MDDDRKEKVEDEDELPPDVANGMLLTLLKNIRAEEGTATVSFLALTPTPRLVKLDIVRAGEDALSLGTTRLVATRYTVKLSGAAALVAPLVGAKPPDLNVWVVRGEAPGFVRSEGALFLGGPIWRIELATPAWR